MIFMLTQLPVSLLLGFSLFFPYPQNERAGEYHTFCSQPNLDCCESNDFHSDKCLMKLGLLSFTELKRSLHGTQVHEFPQSLYSISSFSVAHITHEGTF